MSKHHHHPHEGHRSGNPPGGRTMRHTWFFYLAGIMIFLALIGFIIAGSFRSTAPITNPAPIQVQPH